MSDKRFIEGMVASAPAPHAAPPRAGKYVVNVVGFSKYERPEREMIDEPEPKRKSYDSI